MKGDPAALEGLRKGMADHLVSLSGRDEMRGAAFRKFVDENKTSRTLSNIFTPDQMGVIRLIAADIERSNRTVTANKIPGSPGTAADSHGVAPDAHDLAGPLGAEGVGELASHLLGMTGIGAVVTRLAALGGRSVLARAKQAGLARQDQIATQMLLHPEFGRAVLQAVRAKNPGPGFWNRIGGVAGNLALAGQTMPPVVSYREMQRQ
jgi:phage-related tail protein